MRKTKRVACLVVLTLACCNLAACGVVQDFVAKRGTVQVNNTVGLPKEDGSFGLPEEDVSFGLPEEDVSFELTQPSTPDFEDDVTPGVEGTVDSPEINPGPTVPDTVGPMYVEQDGLTHLMDPATLQPTGGPLDPTTKEPLQSQQDEEAANQDDSPSAEEPTEDTKYPNTGIFLEDD